MDKSTLDILIEIREKLINIEKVIGDASYSADTK